MYGKHILAPAMAIIAMTFVSARTPVAASSSQTSQSFTDSGKSTHETAARNKKSAANHVSKQKSRTPRAETASSKPTVKTSMDDTPANNQKSPEPGTAALTRVSPVKFISDFEISKIGLPAAPAHPASMVQIVFADELNEIDLMAPPTQKDASDTAAAAAPEEDAVSASEAPAQAELSWLERMLMTFAGAFGTASAIRIFIG